MQSKRRKAVDYLPGWEGQTTNRVARSTARKHTARANVFGFSMAGGKVAVPVRDSWDAPGSSVQKKPLYSRTPETGSRHPWVSSVGASGAHGRGVSSSGAATGSPEASGAPRVRPRKVQQRWRRGTVLTGHAAPAHCPRLRFLTEPRLLVPLPRGAS
jgi:hypothetical protein